MANNKKTFITCVLLILVVVSLSIWAALRLNKELSEVETRISQMETAVLAGQKKIRTLPKIREEVEYFKELEKAYTAFVPDQEGQARFMQELALLARRKNLMIGSCKIADRIINLKDPSGYVIYQWNLVLYGSYNDFFDFLQNCDEINQFVRVSNLSLHSLPPESEIRVRNADQAYTLGIDLTLDLLYKPE